MEKCNISLEEKHSHECSNNHHEHNCNHEHCCSCCCADEISLKKIVLSIIFFGAGIAAGYFQKSFFKENFIKLNISGLLYLVSYLLCGKSVVKNAVKNIFSGNFFDEQFLMTIASIGAVFIGEIPEAVAVMLFYQIGEFFQKYASDKSKKSIDELMKIRPEKAFVIRNGKTIEILPEELEIGETVIVKAGEKIPADGVVSRGTAFIDNSTLTGESVPVEVFEGSKVFSGAVNTNAVIEIKTEKLAQESAAARIIKLIEQSSKKKTKTERFITRFSKKYTPIVCISAVLIAVIPVLVSANLTGNWQWGKWIYRSIIFLVVSCPCALVISVPLSFFSGIGAASSKGILIKGSSSIEALANLQTAVFDKTGTLTKGIFEVSDIHCCENTKILPEELIAAAAHAETYCNHPISKSLKNAHNRSCCSKIHIENTKEIAGQGIEAVIDGKTILAGNENLMKTKNVAGFNKCSKGDEGTIVHIAIDNNYEGHIVICDKIKDNSKNAVSKLKKLGIKNIAMLTGDSKISADKTAAQIGITKVYSELLPEDKVSIVETLLQELYKCGKKTGTLAFAGDGINDAPVLARADVGIAMGGLGADAAIEAADVVIMNDEPLGVAEAVSISKKTIKIVYQNIIFALSVKIIIMILGALGFANMWTAVFGDTGVTFIAVLNAMRMILITKKI